MTTPTPDRQRFARILPLAMFAMDAASVEPSISALSMSRPESPSASEATDASLM